MTAATTTTPDSRARLAYVAYGKEVGFVNAAGKPMPTFDGLGELRAQAWRDFAATIWEPAATDGGATDPAMANPQSRAQAGYDVYRRAVDFTAVNGEPLPEYEQQAPRMQAGWQAAATLLWDLATTGKAILR